MSVRANLTAALENPDGRRSSSQGWVRRLLTLLVAAVTLGGAIGFGSTTAPGIVGQAAPTAEAATQVWVYVVTPNWWGWCSSTAYTSFSNTTTGHSGGDGGDDIVWIRMNLNQSNTIHIQKVGCNQGTIAYVRPTRSGQAAFISRTGSVWLN